MSFAEVIKVTKQLEANNIVYSNNSNMPIEFASMLIHNSNNDNSNKSYSVRQLLQPTRKTVLEKTIEIHKLDVLDVVDEAKQRLLQRNIQNATPEGYFTNTYRSKQTIWSSIPIVTDAGVPKIVRTATSSIIRKLANEREAMAGKQLTLQQLYDTCPLHFEYAGELSIYRWLAPSIVTADYGTVLLHITDGKHFDKLAEFSERAYDLYSLDDVADFVSSRLEAINKHIEADTVPECSSIQKGTTEPIYRVQRLNKQYKWITVKGSKTNSKKEAQMFIANKGKQGDRINVEPAINLNCIKCQFNNFCSK